MNNKNREEIITMFNAEDKIGLHFTTAHRGKMEGMYSLSTSCKVNENCAKYAEIKGSICEKCYAQTQLNCYKSMIGCLEKNTELLTSRILDKKEIPIINAAVFRFEAFGDLVNETQVINYFNICKKNKKTDFALWTKSPQIIEKAINMGHKKPKNLQINWSSLMINAEVDVDKYDFVDRVFTVYDKKTIKEKGIEINCGTKKCLGCQVCYHKNGVKRICEKLK